jgi:hypothetical protein
MQKKKIRNFSQDDYGHLMWRWMFATTRQFIWRLSCATPFSWIQVFPLLLRYHACGSRTTDIEWHALTRVSLISCWLGPQRIKVRSCPHKRALIGGVQPRWLVGPRRPAPYKRRWEPATLITKLIVPYTPPTPQTLADLVVRRSQRRDCSPPVPRRRPTPSPSPVSAVGDPKVAGISSEPLPAPPTPTRGPATHEGVSRTPSLSLSHA